MANSPQQQLPRVHSRPVGPGQFLVFQGAAALVYLRSLQGELPREGLDVGVAKTAAVGSGSRLLFEHQGTGSDLACVLQLWPSLRPSSQAMGTLVRQWCGAHLDT